MFFFSPNGYDDTHTENKKKKKLFDGKTEKGKKRKKSFLQYLIKVFPSPTQNRQNKKGKKGKIISIVSFWRYSTRIRKSLKQKRKNPKNSLIPSPVAFLLSSEIPRVFLYNSYSDPESSYLCYTDTSQRTSRHLCNFWWIGMKANLENIFVIA